MLSQAAKILAREDELDKRCERFGGVIDGDREVKALLQEAKTSLADKNYIVTELCLALIGEELR